MKAPETLLTFRIVPLATSVAVHAPLGQKWSRIWPGVLSGTTPEKPPAHDAPVLTPAVPVSLALPASATATVPAPPPIPVRVNSEGAPPIKIRQDPLVVFGLHAGSGG